MATIENAPGGQDGSVTGAELVPVSDGGTGKYVTVQQVSDFTVDQIEAISAASAIDGDDSVFVLRDGELKPLDVDTVVQYALDEMWAKADSGAPAGTDEVPLKESGGTEQTLTMANLAEYVRATIESAILDVSDLADGSGSLATTDYMLVTQGTSARRIQVSNLSTIIYDSLLTHVTGLSAVTTSTTADILYCIQGGVAKKVTLAELQALMSGNIDGSGTADFLAQWSDTDTLQAGPSVNDSVAGFAAGTDNAVPTTAAVRGEMDTIVYDATDIGGALADADEILVDDGGAGTTQRKSALSRLWTWILGKTDVSSASWVLDEDTMSSDSNSKVPTQQSVKAYVDSAVVAYDGDIADLDIDGATDIGAALEDADLIIVDDGAGGTNRKSVMSRVWIYIKSKIQALSQKAIPVDADILTIQDSEDSNELKEVTVGELWDNRFLGDAQAIKLDDFATPDDNTDLDATDTLHGLMGKADKLKLDQIEALADVTNATKVAAAGAIMGYATDVSSASWVLDEDNFGSDDDTKVPTQQSVKAYVDSVAGQLANLSASSDPTATDDTGSGYSVGSLWVNTTTDKAFVCVDATAAAAVWEDMTESAAGWDGDLNDADFTTGSEIGAALAGTDHVLIGDASDSDNPKRCLISRFKTYLETAGSFSIDALDIDGGTDIGADLADADEIVVDDGGGGTNRRCDMVRVKKYVNKQETASYASNQTLSSAECYGHVIYVTGAATISLPAVADGMNVAIKTVGDVAVSIDPNASDLIYLDGTALDDGDKITNGSSAGDIAVLTYYSADGWYADTNGWTDGGA